MEIYLISSFGFALFQLLLSFVFQNLLIGDMEFLLLYFCNEKYFIIIFRIWIVGNLGDEKCLKMYLEDKKK